MSKRPNIANALAITQIDGPGGLTVTGWRMVEGGAGVVTVARTVPGKQPQTMQLAEADVDAAGWTLFEVVRTRQLEGDFDLAPTEISPLLSAISAVRNALRRDAEDRARVAT
jgi:hypothetical protein